MIVATAASSTSDPITHTRGARDEASSALTGSADAARVGRFFGVSTGVDEVDVAGASAGGAGADVVAGAGVAVAVGVGVADGVGVGSGEAGA
jgi:hypothetical protein